MNKTPQLNEISTQEGTEASVGQKDDVLKYDYVGLPDEARTQAQQAADQIRALLRRAAEDLVEIGTKLLEVKQVLGHGRFGNWINVEFGWSHSTANRLMQVAERFKFVTVTNFAPTALYMLAAPSTPAEAVAVSVERADSGEQITPTIAKTIILAFKSKEPGDTQQIGIATSVQPGLAQVTDEGNSGMEGEARQPESSLAEPVPSTDQGLKSEIEPEQVGQTDPLRNKTGGRPDVVEAGIAHPDTSREVQTTGIQTLVDRLDTESGGEQAGATGHPRATTDTSRLPGLFDKLEPTLAQVWMKTGRLDRKVFLKLFGLIRDPKAKTTWEFRQLPEQVRELLEDSPVRHRTDLSRAFLGCQSPARQLQVAYRIVEGDLLTLDNINLLLKAPSNPC